MRRKLFLLLAFFCFVLGVLTIWLPIPTGIPLIAFGLLLLVANNRRAAGFIRRQRQAYAWFDAMLCRLEGKLGGKAKRILALTKPFVAAHSKEKPGQKYQKPDQVF